MSWLLGCLGETKGSCKTAISQLHPAPLTTTTTEHSYLAAGGIRETLHWRFSEKRNIRWLVAGTGIVAAGCNRFLNDDEWEECFRDPEKFSSLGGSFIALRWNGERLECYNDPIGLRTLYFATSNNKTYFSTRLDWVARLSGFRDLDLRGFGSRWLCVNQLSHGSPISHIQKLGPGGSAILSSSSAIAKTRPWHTDFLQSAKRNPIEILQGLIALGADRDLSLGLSGGMDSRVLLSLLLSTPDLRFSAYTLGDPLSPDVRVATAIARGEGMPFQHFHEPAPSADDALLLGAEYVAQTNLCEPASTSLLLRSFKKMYRSNQLLIDGAFGELSRRQYLKRLLFRGKAALLSGDPRKTLPFLRVNRGRFFRREVIDEMEAGALSELESVLDAMPSIGSIGIENYLDLFTIRTRIPNYGADAQAKLDAEVLNVMPYIQPGYLHAALALPIEERQNGRFFRRILRTRRPSLMKYPLNKGTTTYPFSLSTLQATLWTKAKMALGLCYNDPTGGMLLRSVKETVLDMIASRDVKEYALYDHHSVASLVTTYYGGDHKLQSEVLWWLSFELWRKNFTLHIN